jgi:hypothetical protein
MTLKGSIATTEAVTVFLSKRLQCKDWRVKEKALLVVKVCLAVRRVPAVCFRARGKTSYMNCSYIYMSAARVKGWSAGIPTHDASARDRDEGSLTYVFCTEMRDTKWISTHAMDVTYGGCTRLSRPRGSAKGWRVVATRSGRRKGMREPISPVPMQCKHSTGLTPLRRTARRH